MGQGQPGQGQQVAGKVSSARSRRGGRTQAAPSCPRAPSGPRTRFGLRRATEPHPRSNSPDRPPASTSAPRDHRLGQRGETVAQTMLDLSRTLDRELRILFGARVAITELADRVDEVGEGRMRVPAHLRCRRIGVQSSAWAVLTVSFARSSTSSIRSESSYASSCWIGVIEAVDERLEQGPPAIVTACSNSRTRRHPRRRHRRDQERTPRVLPGSPRPRRSRIPRMSGWCGRNHGVRRLTRTASQTRTEPRRAPRRWARSEPTPEQSPRRLPTSHAVDAGRHRRRRRSRPPQSPTCSTGAPAPQPRESPPRTRLAQRASRPGRGRK